MAADDPAADGRAGGRLFVDVTSMLASTPAARPWVTGMGRSDPLIADALRTVLDRAFIPAKPDEDQAEIPVGSEPATIEPIRPASPVWLSAVGLDRL